MQLALTWYNRRMGQMQLPYSGPCCMLHSHMRLNLRQVTRMYVVALEVSIKYRQSSIPFWSAVWLSLLSVSNAQSKENCGHRLLHGMIECSTHAFFPEGGPAEEKAILELTLHRFTADPNFVCVLCICLCKHGGDLSAYIQRTDTLC